MERFGADIQTPPHPESPTSGAPEVQSKAKPAGLTPGRSKPAPADSALRPIPEAGPGTAGTPPTPVLPTYPNTAAAPSAGPTPTSGAHYIVPAADVQRLQAYELNGVAALTARMTALELQKTQTDERIMQAAAGAAALDKEFQAGQESRMTALESFRVTTEAVMSAAGTSEAPAAVTELLAKLQEDISSLQQIQADATEAHGRRMDRHREELSSIKLCKRLASEQNILSRLNAIEAFQQQQASAMDMGSLGHSSTLGSRGPCVRGRGRRPGPWWLQLGVLHCH